jgi:hypothetical protein
LLDDGLTERHLAVAGQNRPVAVPHGEDGRTVKHGRRSTVSAGDRGVKKTGLVPPNGDNLVKFLCAGESI